MSYRKKHYPAKPEKPERDSPLSDVEYGRPGTERSLFTGRLTSGLPYQRPVDEKEVNRLIREWDDRLLDRWWSVSGTGNSTWWTGSTGSPPCGR